MENRVYILLLIIILGIVSFVGMNHREGHSDDKGYRLCMHIVDPDNVQVHNSDYLVENCEEYLGIPVHHEQ